MPSSSSVVTAVNDESSHDRGDYVKASLATKHSKHRQKFILEFCESSGVPSESISFAGHLFDNSKPHRTAGSLREARLLLHEKKEKHRRRFIESIRNPL